MKRAFISINRLRGRKKPVPSSDWILDSGAFTEISTHGEYRSSVEDYATEANRLALLNPGLKAVVSQDYMCEPWIVQKTGLTVFAHQHLTIARYDALLPLVKTYLMPVLQGYTVGDYLAHLDQYGHRLWLFMYVGVGSICKRNTDVEQIKHILGAIKQKRPNLRLHGFGLKTTALADRTINSYLHSADSMAWSFAARRKGRNQNDWREAASFVARIEQ